MISRCLYPLPKRALQSAAAKVKPEFGLIKLSKRKIRSRVLPDMAWPVLIDATG